MELLPGLTFETTLSFITGLMVKVLMVLLLLMSVIMVRQESLMNKVINIPLGHRLGMLTWAFFFLILILTAVVVVA